MSEDDFLSLEEDVAAERKIVQTVQSQTAQDLEDLAASYRKIFITGPATASDVQRVIDDLTAFCRGYESTYDPDTKRQLHLEGRREVWLRIMEYSRLAPDTLFDRIARRNLR